MYKLISNLKIKLALMSLKIIFKMEPIPFSDYYLCYCTSLKRNESSYTYSFTAWFICWFPQLVKPAFFVSPHCFQHLCKEEEPQHYFLESQLV